MCQQLTKRACRRTVVTKWKCDCCGEVWIHLALKLQSIYSISDSPLSDIRCTQMPSEVSERWERRSEGVNWFSMVLTGNYAISMHGKGNGKGSQVDMQPHAHVHKNPSDELDKSAAVLSFVDRLHFFVTSFHQHLIFYQSASFCSIT